MDIIEIQKMVFVYNAVLSGWSVRLIDNNKFEFKKDRRNQEFDLDDYLRGFVAANLSVDSLRPNTSPASQPMSSPETTSSSTLSEDGDTT